MRSLLFTIWIQADKSVTSALNLLEQLTLAQVETIQQGGARMVNASLAGKQFSYELPANWGVFDFAEMIRTAYKRIKTGGASSGEMTDAELEAYVLDASDEVTDTLCARVGSRSSSRF